MPSGFDEQSLKCRSMIADPASRRLRVANLRGTTQECDLSRPANCDGLGRIHHFRRRSTSGWPENPLPMDPAAKALGIPRVDTLRAQVFQVAACNLRCWYCFVPDELLGAADEHSTWVSCVELLDLYAQQSEPPCVIDLSGGNPDLVPEWAVWMLQALTAKGLADHTYLWADDNLTTDFFWSFLSGEDRKALSAARNFGRVGCFKGFDHDSFTFNTGADPLLFDQQFEAMQGLLQSGIDVYAYVTFTTSALSRLETRMAHFVDRLQGLDENLPLRTVPLEIGTFTPTRGRLNEARVSALANQHRVVECWLTEVAERFSSSLRSLNITDVPLRERGPRDK
jgi:uncharacterized Fe-S cluster-containing radical SAM superfamily protein